MKLKHIQKIEYQYGQEDYIKRLLYQSKEPLLIKIKDFTDQFTLDYFKNIIHETTSYDIYENDHRKSYESDDFTTVISHIQNNLPHRIFGQILRRDESGKIERHVPLWQNIPFRPRYFYKSIKVLYFFGGKGAHTEMHYDREHCSILHLCLCGKKQFLLFTEDQSNHLYKLPFIGDSLVEFGNSWDILCKQYPRLNQAEGYNVILERGDMLFLPKNCWHYTTYLDASAAASYVFYPHKFLQFYGYFTGYFFLGYKEPNGFRLGKKPLFIKFSQRYALAEGKKKILFKIIETVTYVFLLPALSIATWLSLKLKPRRLF